MVSGPGEGSEFGDLGEETRGLVSLAWDPPVAGLTTALLAAVGETKSLEEVAEEIEWMYSDMRGVSAAVRWSLRGFDGWRVLRWISAG